MKARTVGLLHGTYYVVGGLWPLVHMRSFEAVTGSKSDRWLVRTMSALLVGWGAAVIAASDEDGPSSDLARASATAAAVLAAADVWYVTRGRIAATYLIDGAIEAALVIAWGCCAPTLDRWKRAQPTHRRSQIAVSGDRSD